MLKETFKNYDEKIKEAVDFEKNKHQWLLGTQKPLFATAHTKELVGGLKHMQKISKQLREKCGDKFIGLTVFGSASKGYFLKSDIDFAIIAKEEVMEKIYQHLNKEITPNYNYEYHGHIEIGENNDVLWGEEPSDLFKGLFFGDYQKLIQIQKKALENIDKNKWDEYRIIQTKRELDNFYKLVGRFGIAGEKLEKLKIMTILSRTPPPYEETSKIVQKNEKMLSKAKRHTNFGK